jgi:hypothetical protein
MLYSKVLLSRSFREQLLLKIDDTIASLKLE